MFYYIDSGIYVGEINEARDVSLANPRTGESKTARVVTDQSPF